MKTELVPYAPAISTTFVPPTNTRGPRVKAIHLANPSRKLTIPWDHAVSADENHQTAAEALLDQVQAELARDYAPDAAFWELGSRCGCNAGGYVFMCKPRGE